MSWPPWTGPDLPGRPGRPETGMRRSLPRWPVSARAGEEAGREAVAGGRRRVRRSFAPPFRPGGGLSVMRTLCLHPPSYEGFDGGAGSRYQARREIRSFWYPDLAGPGRGHRAGQQAGGRARGGARPRRRAAAGPPVRPRGAAHQLPVVRRGRRRGRGAQAGEPGAEARFRRGQGGRGAGVVAAGVGRDRFRGPGGVRLHHRRDRRGPPAGGRPRGHVPRPGRPGGAHAGPADPGRHGPAAVRHRRVPARPER